MPIKTTVVGAYPKICADRSLPNLRNTLNARDAGRASDADVQNAVLETTKRVIQEQERAGVDVISDGQIRWSDLLNPIARNCEGVEIGGLLRFFNNNTYYRKPIVKGNLKSRGSALRTDFEFAKQCTQQALKVSLPGPFTFADLCVDEHYCNVDALTYAWADVLRCEVEALLGAGCRYIQFEEPSLCKRPEKSALCRKALERITSGLEAHYTVFLYFWDVSPLLGALAEFPVDCVGCDVVSYPENLEGLCTAGIGKELCLGVVDARNTKLETEAQLRHTIELGVSAVGSEKLWISPSASLEFLPHDAAVAKLQRLCSAARATA
jgi:5-methyltetrahydropteroyltriglutamate--homocysteine methyltransferase